MLAPVTKQALRLSASKVYLKASASDFQDHTLQFMHWAHESFSFSIRGKLITMTKQIGKLQLRNK